MNRLKSNKWLVLLISFWVVWLLLIVLGGFAISRGYFMHFFYEGAELSRDEYLALVDEAAAGRVYVHCAQAEFTLSSGYVSNCFDTAAEVMAFMAR